MDLIKKITEKISYKIIIGGSFNMQKVRWNKWSVLGNGALEVDLKDEKVLAITCCSSY